MRFGPLVQRFFDKRDDEASQDAVLAMFAKVGFTKAELFLDLRQNGRYYLFASGA